MRTTLSIDDDVLAVARDLAARRRQSLGAVISELARRSLRPRAPRRETRNGIVLLPGRTGVGPVTADLVNRLRDELP
jgi:hypothetical protein